MLHLAVSAYAPKVLDVAARKSVTKLEYASCR